MRLLNIIQERAEREQERGNTDEVNRLAKRFWGTVETARKYIGNIRKMKSQRNIDEKGKRAFNVNNTDELKRLTAKRDKTKYSRSTYMGLSKG